MPVGLGDEINKNIFKEIASSIFETGKFDDVKLEEMEMLCLLTFKKDLLLMK